MTSSARTSTVRWLRARVAACPAVSSPWAVLAWMRSDSTVRLRAVASLRRIFSAALSYASTPTPLARHPASPASRGLCVAN